MKRILFTSWYTGLGGGETDLLSLAEALDPRRFEAQLLLPADGQLAARWRAAGRRVHIVPFRGATTYFLPAVWARFPVVSRLAELLNEQAIDLVHSDYHALPLIAPAARRANCRTMWTVHGWWFKPKRWQRNFFRNTATVARSYAIRDGFLGSPPFIPHERVPVIYSGLDLRRFQAGFAGAALRRELGIDTESQVVAMVARFQRVKGHLHFQAIAERILTALPETHFIIAGDDAFGLAADQRYRDQILARAHTREALRDRLHYIGFRDDIENVYAAADIFVCPSEFESYGKANLEAMASGKPVVSTRRGGPAETIVEGLTGFLVDPADVEAFTERILRLLNDAALRARMGAAGRERIAAAFSAEAAAAAYTTIFEELLQFN